MTSLTTAELGERWGLNPGTLANWRMFKRGPKYRKIGSRVTYDLDAVIEYEKSCEIIPLINPKRRKKRGS